jgi:hypothetical protein
MITQAVITSNMVWWLYVLEQPTVIGGHQMPAPHFFDKPLFVWQTTYFFSSIGSQMVFTSVDQSG